VGNCGSLQSLAIGEIKASLILQKRDNLKAAMRQCGAGLKNRYEKN
jgi:hypothetical protein